MSPNLLRRAAIAAVLLAAPGCASRVNVGGKVVENGRPVPQADLRLVSPGDDSLFINGLSDDDGNYVLVTGGQRGVPPGRYEVTVTFWRMRNGQPLPKGEQGAAVKGTPATVRYVATLSHEITAKTTTLNVDVSGKAKAVAD